ncbi:methyltransferase [Xylophilus sp. ASV27]|uniref:methyltransferase n=1 Tax=Xylophilus sp. ASV27 TaxID=2795129 RepID=UPI0018ECDA8B|nr:methyltransferase domain-containing protein [Xylophilus sp. ASV27]
MSRLASAPVQGQRADPVHFEALHSASADPWGVHRRWYERRKRSLLLAALPREHYGLAFEPGCSVGGNTLALAARCSQLVSADASAAATARARAAVAGLPQVRVEHWRFPDRWPSRNCDLVVVSELAYYLSERDFARFLLRAPAHLTHGGHLLLCHWRAPIADAFRSGDSVHQAALAGLPLAHVGAWRDQDMRVDVWQNGAAPSVAAALQDGAP